MLYLVGCIDRVTTLVSTQRYIGGYIKKPVALLMPRANFITKLIGVATSDNVSMLTLYVSTHRLSGSVGLGLCE